MHAVRLDQRHRGLDGLQQRLVGRAGGRRRRRVGVSRCDGGGGGRRGRLRGVAELGGEVLEDRLVEAVLALQVGLDDLEELAGLGALDDAMVVRRRHRHHLLGADHLADRAEAGRVADRAGGDDRALAGHQPGNGSDRSDPAGVGERDVGALQVVGGELVLAGAAIRSLNAPRKPEKLRRPASRMTGTISVRAAVLLLDVDRDAEVDGAVVDAVRLAVDLGEVMGHHRHLLGGGAGDRVGDQVGEGDLVAGGLELLAARVERGDGERAERGGGRDRPRLVHVAREHRRRALDQRGVLLRGRRRAAAALPLLPQDVGLGMRPPGPLPWTFARSMPSAAATRRATGEMRCRPAGPPRRCSGSATGSGVAWAGGAAAAGSRRWRRLHAADDLADGHGVARVGEDLLHHAGGGGGDLGVDLVGRDLDDRLVGLDGIAGLLGPLEDHALGDRLAHPPAW